MGNRGFRRYLRVEKDAVRVNRRKVEEEARYDGKWVLRTNTDLPAGEVALQYKRLLTVERFFREAKDLLETRPIFHKYQATIAGHIFVSFLALAVRHEICARLGKRGHDVEWADVVRDLGEAPVCRAGARQAGSRGPSPGEGLRPASPAQGSSRQGVRGGGRGCPSSGEANPPPWRQGLSLPPKVPNRTPLLKTNCRRWVRRERAVLCGYSTVGAAELRSVSERRKSWLSARASTAILRFGVPLSSSEGGQAWSTRHQEREPDPGAAAPGLLRTFHRPGADLPLWAATLVRPSTLLHGSGTR